MAERVERNIHVMRELIAQLAVVGQRTSEVSPTGTLTNSPAWCTTSGSYYPLWTESREVMDFTNTVAALTLDGLAAGRPEILADEFTRQAKAGLSTALTA